MNERMHCPHCGRKIHSMDLTCPFCGVEVPQKSSGGFRKMLIKGILGVLLVMGIWSLLGREIQVALWRREADEGQYESYVCDYYTIPEAQWELLHQGDYCAEGGWEEDFCALPDQQLKALRHLAYDVKWGISRKEALREAQRKGVSAEDAAAALEVVEIDWDKMALKLGLRYLETSAYSEKSLQKQLLSAGFSEEQAAYALDHCGADWDRQAGLYLRELLNASCNSELDFYLKIVNHGFTEAQAERAMSAMDIDWNLQAERRAKMYLVDDWMTRGEVMEILKNEGFSHDQALQGTEFLK